MRGEAFNFDGPDLWLGEGGGGREINVDRAVRSGIHFLKKPSVLDFLGQHLSLPFGFQRRDEI